MKKYDVAVLFGGISNENEISIITGTMVCNVLKNGGRTVLPIYISQSGKMYAGDALSDLQTFKNNNFLSIDTACICDGGAIIFNKRGKLKSKVAIDCCLNCCHGGIGEGGGASGLFAINNIPFASAQIFESAAFMDKYYTKLLLKGIDVLCAPYVYLNDILGAINKAEELGYPLIVKPCKLGSSIGIKKVDDQSQLISALQTAFQLDNGVLLEKYFTDKREINCAAYMSEDKIIISDCEEPVTVGDIFSYDDKYSGNCKSVFPADIPQPTAQKIKQITHDVYKKLNMRSIVRFDYILAQNQIYLSEVNTVPGSLSYYLISHCFSDFYDILIKVIEQAKRDYKKSREKLVINTGIINNFIVNACKIK